jgi:hypothetical protein
MTVVFLRSKVLQWQYASVPFENTACHFVHLLWTKQGCGTNKVEKRGGGPRQAESRGCSLDLKWVRGCSGKLYKSQTNPRELPLQAYPVNPAHRCDQHVGPGWMEALQVVANCGASKSIDVPQDCGTWGVILNWLVV